MEIKLGGTQYCPKCGNPSPNGLGLPEECRYCIIKNINLSPQKEDNYEGNY